MQQRQDADELGAEVVALQPSLRRFAAVVADLDMDPDDLAQTAIARYLWARRSSTIEDVDAYLRRVVVNLVRDHRRHAARRRSATLRIEDSSPPLDADAVSLYETLALLSPDLRAVLWLVDVEGWDCRSAAEVLGRSHASVRAMASRGRRRLRTLLDDLDEGRG